MDTFVKAVRIILAVSVIAGCLGKAIYDGISGSSLASAIGDGLMFGVMFSLVLGVFCCVIWGVAAAVSTRFTGKSKKP
jgi:hypothetical protein